MPASAAVSLIAIRGWEAEIKIKNQPCSLNHSHSFFLFVCFFNENLCHKMDKRQHDIAIT